MEDRKGGVSKNPSACPEAPLAMLQSPRSLARTRSAYIVSSVYEARFKSFTFAFTLLMPLRLRSLRMPLAAFLATTLDVLSSTDTAGINGLHPESALRPPPRRARSFRANPAPLSLNPRYSRADHLGNLSSCVDDISDPDEAWEPNDLSRDVEYADLLRGGDRSLPHAEGHVVLWCPQKPRLPSIVNV